MTTCPHATDPRQLRNGDVSVGCRLAQILQATVGDRSSTVPRVSQSRVCAACMAQWPNGHPPQRPTPILLAFFPQSGIGDTLAALIHRLRLDAIAAYLGLYDPSTCGCTARRAAANALVPARQLRQCFYARYRLPLPE